jgi:hypothetical protein
MDIMNSGYEGRMLGTGKWVELRVAQSFLHFVLAMTKFHFTTWTNCENDIIIIIIIYEENTLFSEGQVLFLLQASATTERCGGTSLRLKLLWKTWKTCGKRWSHCTWNYIRMLRTS